MPSTILRNSNLSPVPNQGPMFPSVKSADLLFPWLQWLRDLAVAVNAAPQIVTTIPVSSTADGVLGQVAFDPADHNVVYVCTAANHWTKLTGAAF